MYKGKAYGHCIVEWKMITWDLTKYPCIHTNTRCLLSKLSGSLSPDLNLILKIYL